MSVSEEFQQLALCFTDPIQHDYEVIRGIMLADESVAERSRMTGVDRDAVAASRYNRPSFQPAIRVETTRGKA